MAKFYENLRSTIDNVQKLAKWGKIPSSEDTLKSFQDEMKEKTLYETEGRRAVDEEIKRSAPLRDVIEQLSDGRVVVDKGIYDEGTLKKVLTSVLKMKQFNDGVLFPAYTIVSDPGKKIWEDNPYVSGFIEREQTGTKNSPYKVSIRNANLSRINNWVAEQNEDSTWHPKTGDKTEDPTIMHELSHSAQYDANKKIKDPALTFDYAEKIKRQKFRDTHLSPQQLFDKAANNLGFKDAAEAAMGVSGYAAEDAGYESWAISKGTLKPVKNWSPQSRLPEVFAEAYTDVLYNGDKANQYSKELMRLYTDYVNDYEKTFGKNSNKNVDNFKHALGILPPLRDEEEFVKRLRAFRILPQE